MAKDLRNYWRIDVEDNLYPILGNYAKQLEKVWEEHGVGNDWFYKWVCLNTDFEWFKKEPYIKYGNLLKMDNKVADVRMKIYLGEYNLPNCPSLLSEEEEYWSLLRKKPGYENVHSWLPSQTDWTI